jgi:hypothetical protein
MSEGEKNSQDLFYACSSTLSQPFILLVDFKSKGMEQNRHVNQKLKLKSRILLV